ncbi:MAG: single-stranded-DNA-specific exonuclease RecJ [Patescibacteria group bacterium]|nr:single-stranded-DNA-specific exonuclease RecJ [Patescibacteria group bacterium]
MNKIWQIAPKAREEFFKKFPEYDRVILQLLHNRGLRESEEIDLFLHGHFENNHNPFLFNKMAEAIALTIEYIKRGDKICIYGDYDADGMTASALLNEVLSTLRADCFVYIPDRSSEGYGLHQEAIDKAIKKGAKLLITVDGGIRNNKEVDYAIERGLAVIITDHHTPPEDAADLPACLTINPHLQGEKYPFKFLAGVGVAFKFCQALVEKSKLNAEQKKKILEKILDLVAIGTVADCVTLFGENRLLLKKGLEVLNATKRIGLKELFKAAKIEGRELEAWNIGFQIGPRLNASSRMGSAGNAYNLLSTRDKAEAEKEAELLNDRNQRRQKETEELVLEVEEQIKKQLDEKIIIGICPEKSKPWNEGIIGLVAGKISEKYYRPTLIITKSEKPASAKAAADKGYKGSGRSIEEFNLFKAIEEAGDLLGNHGGHPMACGFNLTGANLHLFADKIRKIAKRDLGHLELEPKLKIDCEIPLADASRTLYREIQKIAPFGQHNPEPKFLSENIQIKDIMKMGVNSQHIKFRFTSSAEALARAGSSAIWGVGFNHAGEWGDFKIGDLVDAVYTLDENEFNGNTTLQFKLIDLKLHGSELIKKGHWTTETVYVD